MQKTVEKRERDIARWATRTEGDDDSLDSLEGKPRKVECEHLKNPHSFPYYARVTGKQRLAVIKPGDGFVREP